MGFFATIGKWRQDAWWAVQSARHAGAVFGSDIGRDVLAESGVPHRDGWEREGEDPRYFRQFSEKMAYPMAINIIFYVMTH